MVETQNWRTMFLLFMCIILVFLPGISDVASSKCTEDQYQVGRKCCLKCLPGQRVDRDCNTGVERVCSPCEEDTFQEEPSGRRQCRTCSKCDADVGLQVKQSCTSTSDAVCGPLDGHLCTLVSERGGCTAAQRHKGCSPGQYINQTGTAHKDTECLQCRNGTFSNGTSTSCLKHRICPDGLVQLGTNSTDSECVESAVWGWPSIIGISISVSVVVFILGYLACGRLYTKKKWIIIDKLEALCLKTKDYQEPTRTYHDDKNPPTSDDEGSQCRPDSGSSSTHRGAAFKQARGPCDLV